MSYDAFAKAYLQMVTEQVRYLSEDILMEDRIDWLKNNVKSINSSHDTFAAHRDPAAIVDFMADQADPSKKKIYTQHLLRMYHAGAFRQEDAPRVHDALSNFDKYRAKLPVEHRDIGKYHQISDIESAVAPHIGTGATKAEAREIAKSNLHIPGKHELKYDDENISVYHLKDEDTSKRLYSGKTSDNPGAFPTEWCTAWSGGRQCQFKRYQEEGNMFVVHRKSDGSVFQYHPKSNQFMDVKDNTISSSDFESIKPSLHKAWKDRSLLDLPELTKE
jgi:hypothetical protein